MGGGGVGRVGWGGGGHVPELRRRPTRGLQLKSCMGAVNSWMLPLNSCCGCSWVGAIGP